MTEKKKKFEFETILNANNPRVAQAAQCIRVNWLDD